MFICILIKWWVMLEINREIASFPSPAPEDPKYTLTGDSIEEISVKLVRMMVDTQWPGFRVTITKKTQKYKITLPGGPRFALKNGLVPMELMILIRIRQMSESERPDENGWYRQRSVVELCALPLGMRLNRGFAILSGNKHDL
jgi:hypothetical protein